MATKQPVEYIEFMVWEDGTYCTEEDLEDFLGFMSDCFKVVRIDIDLLEDLDEEDVISTYI